MLEVSRDAMYNLENALRGARNPLSSWHLMDSEYLPDGTYQLGEKDLNLLQRLVRAGNDHRKFMRQILVSADILAPMYWWKEFDTYKVGTVANSTSTMHKIHSKPFSLEDFSHDQLSDASLAALEVLMQHLEAERLAFVETKDKQHWWNIIQLLPSSYNQLRTVSMNYEVLRSMYFARKSHKLQEWHTYCDWVETLPYGPELICLK